MNFSNFNFNEAIVRAVEDCGYLEPTSIQQQAIPVMMAGQDIIGQSQTGTGKTAAFALPILQNIVPLKKRQPQALILCPTRELCLQVSDEIRKFAKYLQNVRIVSVFGGQPITTQIRDLKGGADIIVGTPGRTIDHINRKTLRFDQLHTLVLDEADEMLNMGFREDIETIIESLPTERQTVLFSATMPKAILDITNKYQTNPHLIQIKQNVKTAEGITQYYYEVNQSEKTQLQIQLIELYKPQLAMIFCNTKKQVDTLTAVLLSNGYQAACIHGDMKQEMRTAVMNRFKKKAINILVATDVAARGIDVDNMDVVFNFDVPQELEYYIHRIGRTGRAGKDGLAITFVTNRQRSYVKQIEKITKSKIEKQPLPTKDDLKKMTFNTIKNDIELALNSPINSEAYNVIKQLEADGYPQRDILAALINEKFKDNALTVIKESSSKKRVVTHKNSTPIEINVGKNQGIAAAHIVSSIADASNIDGKDIGKIRISANSTQVEVPEQFVHEIIDALQQSTIKGLNVSVKRVRKSAGKPASKNRRSRLTDLKSERKKR